MNTKKEINKTKIEDLEVAQRTFDAYGKELLSNKNFMAILLKNLVDEYKDSSIETIAREYIEPQFNKNGTFNSSIVGINTEINSIEYGKIILDLVFLAKDPNVENDEISLIINTEVQRQFQSEYDIEDRAMYCTARLLDYQRKKVFEGSKYSNLKKVYSIWLCFDSNIKTSEIIKISSQRESLISRKTLEAESFKNRWMTTYIVYIGKDAFRVKNNTINDVAHAFKVRNDKFKEYFKSKYGINVFNSEDGEENMFNLSQNILDEGKELGYLKGKEDGIIEGKAQTLLAVIKNLLKEDVSIEVISQTTNVSVEDIENIKRQLNS